MIVLSGVSHTAQRGGKTLPIFDKSDFVIGEGHVGLVVDSAATADVLFDLLVGYIQPKAGVIRRTGRVSWPIGRLLQFRSELSGRKTLHFLCRIYNLDFHASLAKARSMMDFGRHFDRGILHWPPELMLEFAYFAALLPDFDTYFVEGTANTSNQAFNLAWHAEFTKRVAGKNLIYQSSGERYIEPYASSALALVNGKLRYFDTLEKAFAAVHNKAIEVVETREDDDRFLLTQDEIL